MSEAFAVVGAGVMGRGIALAVALSGAKVTLVSRRGQKGYVGFLDFCKKEREKKRISISESNLMSHVGWSESLSQGVKDANIVIETLEENEDIKLELFKKLGKLCPKNVVLSSNTSSLSINDLSRVTESPERVIGLHFFNPAHVMRLVEVVPCDETSSETVQKAFTFVHNLGKEPVIVKDSPGFLVNRVLFTMINEALYCLMDGLADAGTIDKAMELGANLPMGPLKLVDYIGVDVCLNILRNIYMKTGNSKYLPCPILEKLVEKGYLGRKAGKGIYDFSVK